MPMPAKKPVTTPIPVQLSATEFNQCILPHLSMPLRGPKCKLGYQRVFTLILWVLYTGMQWKCLPVPTDREGKAEIHYTTVYKVFAKWADDGSIEHAFVGSVGHLSEHNQLDLSILHGDGTNTVAKKGGDGIGYSGHKHHKGEKVITIIDNNGYVLAPLPVAPVNEADTVLLPEGLQALKRVARLTGLGLTGAYLNLDGGFDSRHNRKAIFNAGLIPNIQENPRNRKTTKRGRKRLFNDAMHALRDRVERTFAWEDKFKRLLLRFEHIQQRHDGMKLMAYILINVRRFCTTENSQPLPCYHSASPMSMMLVRLTAPALLTRTCSMPKVRWIAARGEWAMTRQLAAFLIAATVLTLVPLVAQAQGQAAALPDGAGKQLVENLCTGCHKTNMITRSSGYTREGWTELVSTMIDLSSVPEDRDAILPYLATHFSPNTARAPRLMPGTVQVSFKEWQTPTLGQRSRDPVQAADGLIWWAGQFGKLIGSINPATGEMKEYPLPANAMPHTVEIDARGNIWYTGNKNGSVGYLDSQTGKITVYKMPDPQAKDPHTLIFDRQGIAWFTLQLSNMIGRLDPATGAIKLVTTKTPDAKPYGIKEDASGALWVACNGAPCLYKVDAATMELTEVKLPLAGTTVRRLDIAADGMIWYVNSGMGQLGRYNPQTSEIKEWASPSGPKSHPYAIVVVDGIVWYNESGMRPDALVRFDPKTETFQSWPIPSGGVYAGIIRHMRAARDGSLLIHQSSTNRIIQVTVQGPTASR